MRLWRRRVGNSGSYEVLTKRHVTWAFAKPRWFAYSCHSLVEEMMDSGNIPRVVVRLGALFGESFICGVSSQGVGSVGGCLIFEGLSRVAPQRLLVVVLRHRDALEGIWELLLVLLRSDPVSRGVGMVGLVKDCGLIWCDLAPCWLFDAATLPGDFHLGIVFGHYTWAARWLTRPFECLGEVAGAVGVENGRA